MWELDHKESWAPKNWCFWTLTLESPLDCKEIKPLNPKGNNPEYSLEGLMLMLKLQYFDHLMWRADSSEQTLMVKDWRQEEKGTTEDEMVGWHHWPEGHEFEQALGVGDGQGSLVCCSPWSCKELDMTERLNWLNFLRTSLCLIHLLGQSSTLRYLGDVYCMVYLFATASITKYHILGDLNTKNLFCHSSGE